MDELSTISPTVLRIENTTDQDFKKFIDWISASVSSQSRSIGMGEPAKVNLAKVDDSVMKKIESISQASALDEDFVVISGRCQKTKLPYLLKYERAKQSAETPDFKVDATLYNLVGVYPAENDFDELSDTRANANTISTEALVPVSPGCPHCGAPYAFAACSCGQILCAQGEGKATCPGCGKEIQMGMADGDFDVTRSRG